MGGGSCYGIKVIIYTDVKIDGKQKENDFGMNFREYQKIDR